MRRMVLSVLVVALAASACASDASEAGPKQQSVAVVDMESEDADAMERQPPFPKGTLCGVRLAGFLECWDPWGGWSEAMSLPGNHPGYVQVASSAHSFVCGIRSDGGAECFDTRLSDYRSERADALRRSVGDGFAQVASGDIAACGLGLDGQVACWDLRDSDPVPVLVAPAGGWGELAGIAVGSLGFGDGAVCGLGADGAVRCLGILESDSSEAPEAGFEPWPGTRFERISMAAAGPSGGSLCGLTPSGVLHCRGGGFRRS